MARSRRSGSAARAMSGQGTEGTEGTKGPERMGGTVRSWDTRGDRGRLRGTPGDLGDCLELGDEGLRKSGRERRGQPGRGLEGRGGVCSGWGSTRLRAVLAGHAWCGGGRWRGRQRSGPVRGLGPAGLRRHLPWGGGNTLPGSGERGLSGPGAGRDLSLPGSYFRLWQWPCVFRYLYKGAKPGASQTAVPENPHAE